MDGLIVPEIMTKVWGCTRRIYQDMDKEVWHASIVAAGYSSCHKHRFQNNDFYIVSGELLVHYYYVGYNETGYTFPVLKNSVVLKAGMVLSVPHEYWHRFEAITDVELIETYWYPPMGTPDIVRYDIGGVGKLIEGKKAS